MDTALCPHLRCDKSHPLQHCHQLLFLFPSRHEPCHYSMRAQTQQHQPRRTMRPPCPASSGFLLMTVRHCQRYLKRRVTKAARHCQKAHEGDSMDDWVRKAASQGTRHNRPAKLFPSSATSCDDEASPHTVAAVAVAPVADRLLHTVAVVCQHAVACAPPT